MPRMSNDMTEEAYATVLEVAGGDSKLVAKAFARRPDGSTVSLEEGMSEIVKLRLEADEQAARAIRNLTTVADI